jgi:hypothetical protein
LSNSSFIVFLIHPLLLEVGKYINEQYLRIPVFTGEYSSMIWFVVITFLSILIAIFHYKLKTTIPLPPIMKKPLAYLG